MKASGGGYREQAEGFPPPDHEGLASRELGRRAARLHMMIVVPSLVSGIVLGVFLYLLLRELQFAMFRAHNPYVTGLVSIAPCFVGTLRFAQRAGNAAVARRSHTWVAELTEQHSLPAGALEDYRRVLCGENNADVDSSI